LTRVAAVPSAVWELVSGETAFEGMSAARILFLVVGEHHRLPIPDQCPAPYAELMEECWAHEPDKR
jgi:Protein tyrosine and serine/threonine kinase